MTEEPPLISSAQLARKLGLSRRTISLYAKKGWITPVVTTPGGQYRWDYQQTLAEMRELAEQRRRDGGD